MEYVSYIRIGVLATFLVLLLSRCDGAMINGTASSSSSSASHDVQDSGELDTFEKVEGKMRTVIDEVIKRVLPYVIRASADIRLSGKCMASIFKLVLGMQKLQEWAIRMVDATGKPPSGVIQGTTMSLGDYDECLNVRVGKNNKPPTTEKEEAFHGKYCTVECKLPKGLLEAVEEYNRLPVANRSSTPIGKTKTFLKTLVKYGPTVRFAAFRFGVCIPSTCAANDLGSILVTATKQIGFPLKVLHCQEKQKLKFNVEHIIILTVLGLIIMCVIAGTSVECYYYLWLQRDPETLSKREGKFLHFARNISIYSNTKKLFRIDNDDHPMPMVRGMFFLTVLLNILAHTYGMYNHLYFFKYSSVLNYLDFMQDFSFTFIANGSNGVENYFFLAGLMMTYARWRLPLRKVTIDIKNLIVRPYIRMSFLQLLAISLFLLLPLIGYGPFWDDFLGPYLQNCRVRWWTNLLYIQNYWSSEDACLYHTWLLAAVMQLYVLSIFILLLLIRKPNVGIFAIIAIIVGGMAAVGATVFVKRLPGAFAIYFIDAKTGPEMWNTLYIQTFDHVGAYCIGLLTGYGLARFQHTLKLRPLTVIVFWCISVASILAVIFGLYEYRYGGIQMNESLAIIYAMLNRNVYALFLAWFVVACATGNAGIVPKLLSWRAWIPGYRLSFIAYLIHLIFIYYHVGVLRERVYMSHEENVVNYFGYLVATFLISYVCYIFFQAPFLYLESIFFSKLIRCMKTADGGNIALDRTSSSSPIKIGSVSKGDEKSSSRTGEEDV